MNWHVRKCFRPRRGFTLIEVLVAVTLTLMMMAAVVQIFALVGRSINKSRSTLEMSEQLRATVNRLRLDLEGVTASELPLTMRAEGDVANLIDFVTRLNGDLTTGVVKSAEISIPETADEGKPSANIRLVVYSYQGD